MCEANAKKTVSRQTGKVYHELDFTSIFIHIHRLYVDNTWHIHIHRNACSVGYTSRPLNIHKWYLMILTNKSRDSMSMRCLVNKWVNKIIHLSADGCQVTSPVPMVFTALHGMQTRSSDENSVRPSVPPSVRPSVTRVICDNTVERSVQIYIPYERTFSLVFREEEWLVGQPLLPEILGQPDPVGAKSPILNR